MLGTILIIILILVLIGALPQWPYAAPYRDFGYRPFGVVGLVLLIVLILVLAGRL